MSGSSQHSSVRIVVADPSALGLFGLAMVTLVASSQKLGLTTGLSFVVPWALFLGSMAQLMACVYDFKHGNTFGATAFGAYGLFWAGVAASWLIRMGVFGPELAAEVDPRELGMAFLGYTIFSVYMTIGALETHKVLFSIFVLIDVLLGALAYNAFYPQSSGVHALAAWSELAISLISFYGSAAAVLNNHFGRPFVPVGRPFGWFK